MSEVQEYQPAAARPKQLTTHQFLERMTPEIARALPKGMDADRIARLVLTEVRKTPRLTECTQESFAGALLTASALGLEPGVMGECYLVPYRDNKKRIVECQLIIGYQGITKLFWQHDLAAGITAEWVGANDKFRFVKGLNPVLEHEQAPQGERGEPVYYYAVVRVKGREPLWDVFTPDEIKRLRRGKVGSSGDIADPMHWMERKTALKQVLKLAPKTTRLDVALKADERGGVELKGTPGLIAIGDSPDYIDGQVDEQLAAVEPSPTTDVRYVTEDQLSDLAQAREHKFGKGAKAGEQWQVWRDETCGRTVASDAELTEHEAGNLLALAWEDDK